MIRSVFCTLVFVCAFALLPSSASGQFVVGAHGGYNLDVRPSGGEAGSGAAMVGAQLQFRVAPLPIVFNPAVDLFLAGDDDFTATQIDANILLPFVLDNDFVTPYIGGGFAITRLSTETTLFGDAETQENNQLLEGTTDYGANVIAGALFGVGSIRPFAQFRATLGSHAIYADDAGTPGEGFGVSAGILFRLSQ